MKSSEIINSNSYWDARFAQDWGAFQGPEQSEFFARLAIENLPGWLIEQLSRQGLTLCDWGCAQGDGTRVWACLVDSGRICGVDFSRVAVDEARSRYPAIKFLHEDWLNDPPPEGAGFDIVFSSNTLEHFQRPHEVLKTLCDRARRAVVLVLPYRELDRQQEHFYTFLPDNIPSVVTDDFRLAWARVLDCRELTGALWGGEQIVLVYAKTDWLDDLDLRLRDMCIERESFATHIACLNRDVAQRDARIACLNRELDEIKRSTSWRMTSPIRFLKLLATKFATAVHSSFS